MGSQRQKIIFIYIYAQIYSNTYIPYILLYVYKDI